MYSVHKKFGQKERNTVTKQEMMQYLSAVSDVEGALYFYEEAEGKLKQDRDSMKPAAVRPERPKPHFEYSVDLFEEYGAGYWISGVVWLVFFILECVQEGRFIWWEAFVFPFLSAGCGWVLNWIGIFVFDACLTPLFTLGSRKRKEREADAIAEAAYEKKVRFYEEACAIENKAIKKMDETIDGVNKKCEELRLQRSQLYAMNVLHPSFQNMIAANQIREYLEMGICDGLEGTNGAYALYMQDVRANRICESIDDLRQTVQEGFNEVKGKMSAVMAELRRTNANIDALNTSINSGFSDMQRAISEGQEKFNANQQASLNEANGYLRSISKTLQDAGHNEYIALKEANVSSYLRRIY